jgi:hypothetical protein
MNSDFEELLRAFNDDSVEYLVVGGHAVMLYSEPRYTRDLDVWIDASAENSVDGVRFEEAWPNRQGSSFDAAQAWFIGRQDLIRNERAVGGHIDLHDAEILE